MRKKKPLVSWDECDIADAEIKYRLEEDPSLDEETARNQVFGDSDVFQNEWEYVTEHLTEILQEKNPDGYWKADVNNFGWRHQSGYKYFKAYTGSEFLRAILPQTDCTWAMYRDGRGFYLGNAHHDAPMRESEKYFIRPATKKEINAGYFD